MHNCIFICFYYEFLFYVQIPENNEEFRVTLTSATQGARVTDQEMILIIQANDAPIRFQKVMRLPLYCVVYEDILNIIKYPLKLLTSEKKALVLC